MSLTRRDHLFIFLGPPPPTPDWDVEESGEGATYMGEIPFAVVLSLWNVEDFVHIWLLLTL